MSDPASELEQLDTHFAFGENWADFAAAIDETRIAQAEAGLRLLVPDLTDRTFLDVGCGSGIHALAALRLGVARARALDLDPASVGTARALLEARAPADSDWSADVRSVFDLDPAADGTWDVVYSWGVLHHTGSMWRAVERAAALVAPGGTFALALYLRTPACGLWRLEKRIYAHSPSFVQALLRWPFKAALVLGMAAKGSNPLQRIREYHKVRGMSWHHDVHDWLGGYPYESATPTEVRERVEALGFRHVASHNTRVKALGLFGSGCGEYVFERA